MVVPARRAALAAAIGGVGVGRDEQRHVVVLARIGDPESDRDEIEEGGIGQRDASGTQVFADVEQQLVGTCHKVGPSQQRLVAAAVVVGGHRGEPAAVVTVDPIELDPQARSRPSAGGVENVGGQPATVVAGLHPRSPPAGPNVPGQRPIDKLRTSLGEFEDGRKHLQSKDEASIGRRRAQERRAAPTIAAIDQYFAQDAVRVIGLPVAADNGVDAPDADDGVANRWKVVPMSWMIRTMSRAEVELALDWAAAEGWNPGLHDATPFQVADPAGFLVGLVDDSPVAIISAVRYSGGFGFLGFYIVTPAWRGRGLGLRLWRAGLEHLGEDTVGLDGGVAQQDNYRRSGFQYAWPNYRFGGRVEGRWAPGLVDARRLPFTAVADLDRLLFPAPRPAFLAAWLGMPDSHSLAILGDDGIVGLGTVRRCRQGHKVGPLYAADRRVAQRLLQGLAEAARADELFVDVPGPNAAAVSLMRELGLSPRFETARMYRGTPPSIALDRLFGIASFELG